VVSSIRQAVSARQYPTGQSGWQRFFQPSGVGGANAARAASAAASALGLKDNARHVM